MPDFILPAGARKLPDTERYANRIQIRSDSSDRKYVIAFDRNLSRYTCGCPSFVYGKGGPCKHLIRLGLVGKSVPEPQPRTKRCRKSVKSAADMFMPEIVWTPEQVAEAALGFAD